MQNGSIGEARTRSFLIDRFWVLERSVDIDGADFIIQRRITSKNLLDRDPPRLGIVQAKFFSGPETTFHIPRSYLIDKDGRLRKEFFVLCHTGDAGEARMFLLTPNELISDFEIVEDDKVRIPGCVLLKSEKYEVKALDLALDRIDRTLSLAEFANNRNFLSWFLPRVTIDSSQIDPIFQEPIDNWWGDIPATFAEMRETAQQAIYTLDEVRESLQSIVESTDPEQALAVAEQIKAWHGTPYGIRIGLPDDLYNESFHLTVLRHKERIIELKRAGLLDTFILLKRRIGEELAAALSKLSPIDSNSVFQATIRYEQTKLSLIEISVSLIPAEDFSQAPTERDRWGLVRLDKHEWCASAIPGHIIYCWAVGRYADAKVEAGLDWKAHFLQSGIPSTKSLMDDIYMFRFGE